MKPKKKTHRAKPERMPVELPRSVINTLVARKLGTFDGFEFKPNAKGKAFIKLAVAAFIDGMQPLARPSADDQFVAELAGRIGTQSTRKQVRRRVRLSPNVIAELDLSRAEDERLQEIALQRRVMISQLLRQGYEALQKR